ncbi:MAG: hypothetical protein ACMXYF_03965 [Candidatus Woesearchaeota archaeon]
MGFGDIASQMILLIAVLGASVALVTVFQNQLGQTSSTISTRQDLLNQQLLTAMNIELLNYENDQLTFYVKNTGSTQMRPQQLSIYVNQQWIGNSSDRLLELVADTDTRNIGVWDPTEVLYGVINITLESGTHTFRIVSPYQSDVSKEFSI